MLNKILLLPLTIFLLQLSTAQVRFVTDLSWEQVKLKAEKQNKFIFLDVMATWCGPCKEMEQFIYPDPELGEFYNKHFIAVKVQIDRTQNDDEYVKSWYATAEEIKNKYEVVAYPTIIFLSPKGELVYTAKGFKDVKGLLSEGKRALDTVDSYPGLIAEYFNGNRDSIFLGKLIKATTGMGRYVMVEKLLQQDYLSKLGIIKPFKPINDFSGTWMINYPLCEFGKQSIRMASKQITIVQADSNIIIKRLQTDGGGKEYTIVESLIYDGKQVDIPTQTGDRIKKVVLLSNDNDLTEFTEVTYPGSKNEIDYTVTENWKLSDNRKRLTVERLFNTNTGRATVVAVYDRK